MSKKIEPTQAMVDWAANILCLDATHTSLRFHAGLAQQAYRNRARAVMRTALCLALNHPDAAGLFADEDAIRAAREQGWDDAADWVKRREAWTDEELRAANPHRAAQELPTASCTIIVPADGHEYIEAKANIVWYANEAVLGPDNRWHGVWRTDSGLAISSVSPEEITPGTWKVADQ